LPTKEGEHQGRCVFYNPRKRWILEDVRFIAVEQSAEEGARRKLIVLIAFPVVPALALNEGPCFL